MWLRGNGCPWSSTAAEKAAEGGHLDVLKWLDANGCDMSSFICSAAAKVRRDYWLPVCVPAGCMYVCLVYLSAISCHTYIHTYGSDTWCILVHIV